MEKTVIILNDKIINGEYLEEIICNHIARNNEKMKQHIEKHHMKSIRKIREYIISILGGYNISASMLNSCYHRALVELHMDAVDFFLKIPDKSSEASLKII